MPDPFIFGGRCTRLNRSPLYVRGLPADTATPFTSPGANMRYRIEEE